MYNREEEKSSSSSSSTTESDGDEEDDDDEFNPKSELVPRVCMCIHILQGCAMI